MVYIPLTLGSNTLSPAGCGPRYLPLCSIPARMSKDGWAGPTAKIYLPFQGFHFFSGATFTPVQSVVQQDQKMYVGGITKPDTYSKDGAWC